MCIQCPLKVQMLIESTEQLLSGIAKCGCLNTPKFLMHINAYLIRIQYALGSLNTRTQVTMLLRSNVRDIFCSLRTGILMISFT